MNAVGQMILELESEADASILRALLPSMLALVEVCLSEGLEAETCDALEVFGMVIESPLGVLNDELFGQLVVFLLQIAESPLPQKIRQTSLITVEFAVQCEAKRVVRLGLLQPILSGMFGMAALPPDENTTLEDDATGRVCWLGFVGLALLAWLCWRHFLFCLLACLCWRHFWFVGFVLRSICFYWLCWTVFCCCLVCVCVFFKLEEIAI